jgi:hypothetical protein
MNGDLHSSAEAVHEAPAQPATTNGLAIASLVLGIISVPTSCCYGGGILFAIPAFITGLVARMQIQASDGTQRGEGMALAGMIMGGLVTAFLGIAIVVIIVLALLGPAIGEVFSNIIQEMGTPVP